MEYVAYKRFKGEGIDGYFNIRYGTVVTERGGFLYTSDGRLICAATSENGWMHFRQNTPEGAYRQAMLERLYSFYENDQNADAGDFIADKWPGAINTYWKNLLRTMNTSALTAYYKKRLGDLPKVADYPPKVANNPSNMEE